MENQELFRTGSVWRAIAKMAVPAVATILVMLLYNLADMFFVARSGDMTQVAAISVVSPVYSMLMAVGSMVGGGGSALIARTLGSGDRNRVQTCSSLCCWGSILLGVAFAMLVLPFLEPLLGFLGADTAMWNHAKDYLRVLALGAPCLLFANVMGNVVRSEGAVKAGLVGSMLGTIGNMILDPLFISVFKLGVGGAAIATVLGNLLSCVWFLRYLRGPSTAFTIDPRPGLQTPLLFLSILALGLPNACSTILAGFASTFSNRILVAYGTQAVAAMGAAGKCTMVISMTQMGLCMGVQPLLAYSCGAQDWGRLREIIRKLALLTGILGLSFTLLCFFARTQLVEVFIRDAAAVELGRRMIAVSVIGGPFLGAYYIAANFLQAAGKALTSTVVSILRQGILLIPLLYLMSALFQADGIAWAHVAADIGATAAAVCAAGLQFRQMSRESVQPETQTDVNTAP